MAPEQDHLCSSRATATTFSESVAVAQHDVRMLLESLASATFAHDCASITKSRYAINFLKKPRETIGFTVVEKGFDAVKEALFDLCLIEDARSQTSDFLKPDPGF